MNYFKLFVEDPLKYGQMYGDTGIPIPLKKLSKYTNYIQKGQSICISGKAESGKTSMMDYTYFISVFRWWSKLDPHERPKLKLIYFNMKHTLKNKVQKWLCLYLKLEFNIIIDIPTLNNGIGKLRDLDDDDKIKIQAAHEFFDELFNHDVLTLVNGAMTPTGVFNRIKTIMEDYGTTDKVSGEFTYYQENSRMITLLYIDTVDQLLSETDGFSMLDSNGVKKKMHDYLIELKKLYNLTSVIVAPSKPMMSRLVKETEPSYKEVNIFGSSADLVLVMYNPYNENNNNYQSYPIKDFVIRGKNRFRTVTIVRNTSGITQIGVGLIFIGENGYFAESPTSNDEGALQNIIETLSLLE